MKSLPDKLRQAKSSAQLCIGEWSLCRLLAWGVTEQNSLVTPSPRSPPPETLFLPPYVPAFCVLSPQHLLTHGIHTQVADATTTWFISLLLPASSKPALALVNLSIMHSKMLKFCGVGQINVRNGNSWDVQRLWVIWGQCCLIVAASPCLPKGPITRISPFFTRNAWSYAWSFCATFPPKKYP